MGGISGEADAGPLPDGLPSDGGPGDGGDGGCGGDDAGLDAPAADAEPDGPVPDAAGVDAPDAAVLPCPPEMIQRGAVCIDRHEASRADATSTAQGVSSDPPRSIAGVLPWMSAALTRDVAAAACASAGKRLCTGGEWESACAGSSVTAYSYGPSYDPTACNGIDAFCNCAGAACSGVAECPYAHCYNQTAAAGDAGPCGSSFHVGPTGDFANCVSADGVRDLNGNVWEIVDSADGLTHARGGAYNCGDSETLHLCTSDVTWNPPARGFRCCQAATP